MKKIFPRKEQKYMYQEMEKMDRSKLIRSRELKSFEVEYEDLDIFEKICHGQNEGQKR